MLLTLIIVNHVTKVISAAIVRLPDAHRIVSKVDIAIIASSRALAVRCATSREFGTYRRVLERLVDFSRNRSGVHIFWHFEPGCRKSYEFSAVGGV